VGCARAVTLNSTTTISLLAPATGDEDKNGIIGTWELFAEFSERIKPNMND
jgi:hypothetical protein